MKKHRIQQRSHAQRDTRRIRQRTHVQEPKQSSPIAQLSMAGKLPDETWLHILSLLPDIRYAVRVGLTSRCFQALTRDPQLQKQLKTSPVNYQASSK